MSKCFMDTVREKNNLADSYGQVKDIPPLLICNQNNKYRIPKLATNNSVLLQDAGIDYEDIKLFSHFKSMIFVNKRKKISTILKKHKFQINNLKNIEKRAEEYSLNDFINLFKNLKPELINKFS